MSMFQPAVLMLTVCVSGSALAATHGDGQPENDQNQTLTVSPIYDRGVPFWVSIEEIGSDGPPIQSAASAMHDNKLVFVGGKSTGFHGFAPCPEQTFPVQEFSPYIHVFDLDTQVWTSRSVTEDPTLSELDQRELSAMNYLYTQVEDRLLLVGGYGTYDHATNPTNAYRTFTRLKVLDLEGVIAWVNETEPTLSKSVHFIDSPEGWGCDQADDGSDPCFFQLTGGRLMEVGQGKDGVHEIWMVLGHSFTNGYGFQIGDPDGPCPHLLSPVQIYSRGFRGFNLDLSELIPTADPMFWMEQMPDNPEGSSDYFNTWQTDWARRRDLNVVTSRIRDSKGQNQIGAIALSGPFTLPPNGSGGGGAGAWTVPLAFESGSVLTQFDVEAPGTLRQGFNIYDSASICLWSESEQANYYVILGGIGYQVLDEQDQLAYQPRFDWSNHTSVVRWGLDRNNWTQHFARHPQAGSFPPVLTQYPPSTAKEPYTANYNGTETNVFLMVDDTNEMIDLDDITEPTYVGLLYGGIASYNAGGEAPDNWPLPNATFASNRMFKVYISPGCIADFNLDGVVNGTDLGRLLAAWGTEVPLGEFLPADINKDGVVNGTDLGLLLNAWGQCQAEDG